MIEYTVRVYPNRDCANGDQFWLLNEELHREDGPAVEFANGYKEWWLNGKRRTEEQHKAAMNPVEEMTVEEICKALGKNVKVIK